MDISSVSLPQVYTESDDFRLLVEWITAAYSKIQYDTENMSDLYDPLRCNEDLLWMLCDTMGFKFDNRLCTAFNRLVLLYFMSMIRTRGSVDGVTLGAEVNLAQFNVNAYGEENEINYNRLEDTSIPANSVYVSPQTDKGFIEIVYFSPEIPVDACIEYVRPLGMYCFQYAGIRFDAKTRISIDARLAGDESRDMSIGATHVGHYRRADYAKLQRVKSRTGYPAEVLPDEDRNPAYYRNSVYERSLEPPELQPHMNAGFRTLYSIQLCNNEHMMEAILQPIFGLGYTPQRGNTDEVEDTFELPNEQNYVDTTIPDKPKRKPNANLRYDPTNENVVVYSDGSTEHGQFWTVDLFDYETGEPVPDQKTRPVPRVNPIYKKLGDRLGD